MSHSNRLTVFVFCIFLSFSSLVSADSKPALSSVEVVETEIIKSPNDTREYQVIRLANQLEVLLVSDPDLKNSAASLSVPIGTTGQLLYVDGGYTHLDRALT